jgi:hypothetical protein
MKLTTMTLCALLSAVSKGTPDDDGLTPGTNFRSALCDGYEGGAKSLCSTYCIEQKCYLTEGMLDAVCEKNYNDFVAETGEEPPCTKPCPCFDANTFAGLDLYCDSYAPDSLFVTDYPIVGESEVIAVANKKDLNSCQLVTNIWSGSPVIVFALLNPDQADTCLDILHGTGCRPLVGFEG